jgi:vesicle-associated membrane protein 7
MLYESDKSSTRAALDISVQGHRHFSCPMQQYFSTNPEADKFSAVRGKIDDVKGIMVQNIEKVLARGEKIELLVDKSDALNRSAAKFEKSSNKLKNQMWWRNG